MPSRLPPYILTSPAGLTVVPAVNGEVILGHSELGDLLTSLEVSLTTEDARRVLIEEATDLMPTLNEARLVEHRGDFLCYSPPPKHIQPVLGRLPEWENVYIATRCGGMGIMLSLGVGQVMAGLIISGGRIPDTVKTMMEILSPARM
jgi:glycine/D-amino acid oxidase-like deaminating enzyme